MAFVAATNAVSAGTSVSVNKPTGAQAGDLGVMIVSNKGSAPASTGWTQRKDDASGTVRNRIFTRLFDGSEGATFSVTGVAANEGVAILLYRGGAASFDLAGTSFLTSSFTGDAPSITPTQVGILLGVFTHGASGSVSIAPAGMTQRTLYTGSGLAVAVYELSPSPAVATGIKSLQWSANGANAAVLLQIY